jgi:hypothetical protein
MTGTDMSSPSGSRSFLALLRPLGAFAVVVTGLLKAPRA